MPSQNLGIRSTRAYSSGLMLCFACRPLCNLTNCKSYCSCLPLDTRTGCQILLACVKSFTPSYLGLQEFRKARRNQSSKASVEPSMSIHDSTECGSAQPLSGPRLGENKHGATMRASSALCAHLACGCGPKQVLVRMTGHRRPSCMQRVVRAIERRAASLALRCLN